MNAHEAKNKRGFASGKLRALRQFYETDSSGAEALSLGADLLEWRATEPSDEELTAVVRQLRITLHETAPTLIPWGASEQALSAAISLIERLAALGKE